MPTVYHREINTRVLFFRHSEARKNPSGGKNISLGMQINFPREEKSTASGWNFTICRICQTISQYTDLQLWYSCLKSLLGTALKFPSDNTIFHSISSKPQNSVVFKSFQRTQPFTVRRLETLLRQMFCEVVREMRQKQKRFCSTCYPHTHFFGLVLQRYEHSKYHCPLMSTYVHLCPLFVCNKLNYNRRFFRTTVNGQRKALLMLRRPRVYKTTSGCRPTVVLYGKKMWRLVSTTVRHHTSIPLKYSPYRGNTGGYGGEAGLTMSKFGFKDYRQLSTDFMLSLRFADYEQLSYDH